MSESTAQHRAASADRRARCAVLTVSDTRTPDTDKGGRLIIDQLEAAGHEVAAYELVQDEPQQIEHQLRAWLDSSLAPQAPPLDAILTTGGTGIASRDTTVEVVRRLIHGRPDASNHDASGKELEGFGEIFRMLSYDEVGPAAMLSRAVAGLAVSNVNPEGTLLFALPGSTNAVNLAMTKLIIPELPHLIWERAR